MNKRFLNVVISKVQNEEYSIHQQKVKLEINGDIILISNACCSEFYDEISEKLKEVYNKESNRFL